MVWSVLKSTVCPRPERLVNPEGIWRVPPLKMRLEAAAPRLPVAVALTVPPLMVMGPVNVFVPLRMRLPEPILMSPTVPDVLS